MEPLWISREKVLQRVSFVGMDLRFATLFQNDQEVVARAIHNDWRSFQFASDNLRKNKDFILHVVDTMSMPSFLEFMDDQLKDDISFMTLLVKNRGCAISWASPRLKKHWPLVLEALTSSRKIDIHDIDPSLWLDPVHVKQALELHPRWSIYFPEQL